MTLQCTSKQTGRVFLISRQTKECLKQRISHSLTRRLSSGTHVRLHDSKERWEVMFTTTDTAPLFWSRAFRHTGHNLCQETIEILPFKRFLERLNMTEKVPQDNKLEEREEAGMTDCHILHCNLKMWVKIKKITRCLILERQFWFRNQTKRHPEFTAAARQQQTVYSSVIVPPAERAKSHMMINQDW